MALRPRLPVFLVRTSYRQRRLRDAARLLPVIGAVLWMIPLLWPRAGDPGGASAQLTSRGVLYIFGVWGLLILASFILARFLRRDEGINPAEDGD